jgi:CheY-like chemotaxis protein
MNQWSCSRPHRTRGIEKCPLAVGPIAIFTVSEAANGAEGLEAYHQSSPDCIILDYQLPDTEGLIVLEKLIPDPTTPLAAVVMLTGTGDDAIATLALKKGAQDYLNKALLVPDDFRRVVHNALDRGELLAQRKRAEMALAASEARYRSIVEDQTEMVSRFHADGTLTFVNAS